MSESDASGATEFGTQSLISTLDSNSPTKSCLLIKPYRLNPSLLDHKFKEESSLNTINNESAATAPINNNRNIFARLFSSFVPLSTFKRDKNNMIIDSRYEYEKYEQDLMNMVMNSKNEEEALSVLTLLWKEMKFCDLIICLNNNQEFLTHRIVLALHSHKFKTYFEKNKREFVTRLNMYDTKAATLQQVITFLYTNQIELSIKKVDDILKCVKELDLYRLYELIEDFLKDLNKKYIFQVLELSRKHKLKRTYMYSLVYIAENLSESLNNTRFFATTYETVVDLIQKINIKSYADESLMLNRVLQWVLANKKLLKNNSTQISHLIDIIRCNNDNRTRNITKAKPRKPSFRTRSNSPATRPRFFYNDRKFSLD